MSADEELIDTARVPGTGGELQLLKIGEDYSINVGEGHVLMTTLAHQSEDALAELSCSKFAGRAQVRVLIGGLGMGFTLAAALRQLADDAQVVVAELVPGVVAWNHGVLGEYAGHPLKDPRTEIHQGDVAKVLRADRGAYDAILLDVDNGPRALTRKKNDWLYTTDGLFVAHEALRPGGILAVWSARPSRSFQQRLRKIGFEVQQSRVPEHEGKGELHAIWLAKRAD